MVRLVHALCVVATAVASASAQSSSPVSAIEAETIDMAAFCANVQIRPLDQLYPEAGLRNRRGGHSVIDCGVDGDGRLNACQIVEESPSGWVSPTRPLSWHVEFMWPWMQKAAL
jgi:hypothetical protein